MEGFRIINSWYNGKYYRDATMTNGRPIENTDSISASSQLSSYSMIDSSIDGEGNSFGMLPTSHLSPQKPTTRVKPRKDSKKAVKKSLKKKAVKESLKKKSVKESPNPDQREPRLQSSVFSELIAPNRQHRLLQSSMVNSTIVGNNNVFGGEDGVGSNVINARIIGSGNFFGGDVIGTGEF